MAKQFESISEKHKTFIEEQKMFIVGTAAVEGRVNISPKGMDTLRVTGPNSVIWLNLTGSGNETAAHVLQNGRMTIMFSAFEGKPLILRLYGKAEILHERDPGFQEQIGLFGETEGARQIFQLDVDMVQTSCGFAIPYMEFQEERTILREWSKNKGEEGIKEYWEVKNKRSIDGFETGIM